MGFWSRCKGRRFGQYFSLALVLLLWHVNLQTSAMKHFPTLLPSCWLPLPHRPTKLVRISQKPRANSINTERTHPTRHWRRLMPPTAKLKKEPRRLRAESRPGSAESKYVFWEGGKVIGDLGLWDTWWRDDYEVLRWLAWCRRLWGCIIPKQAITQLSSSVSCIGSFFSCCAQSQLLHAALQVNWKCLEDIEIHRSL